MFQNVSPKVDQNNIETSIKTMDFSAFTLHKLGKICKYLDKDTTEKLVHTFLTCRLDNSNSLFYGLPDKLIAQLQHTQNSGARLVTLPKSRNQISPILKDLHWLPVKSCLMYTILLLTYKCIHGCAPLYLQELVQMYKLICKSSF